MSNSITSLSPCALAFCLVAQTCDANCEHVRLQAEYKQMGGVMKIVSEVSKTAAPHLYCAPGTACHAEIVVEGVIDEQGRTRDVSVMRNSFSYDAGKNAALATHFVSSLRYMPPQIKGQAVCVRFQINLGVNAESENEMRGP